MTAGKDSRRQASPVIEKQFESLVRAATDAILGVDHHGKITIWNKGATKMFGHSAKQAIGMNLHDLIVPDRMLAKTRKGFRNFVKTGKGPLIGKTTECIALRKGGSKFPVELSISGFKQDDYWYAVGIIRDITDRRQTEEWTRTLTEASSAAIYLFDDKMHFLYTNPAGERLLGYTRDELLSKSILDVDVDPGAVKPAHEKLARGEPLQCFEHKLRCKDGNIVTVLNNSVAIKDSRGKITNWCSFLVDISKRKHVEQALAESEEKFRSVVETANAAIFIYQGTTTRYVNPVAISLTGYSQEELLTMDFWEIIHPDFRMLAKERGLARQKDEAAPSSYEIKIARKNGEERWLDFNAARIEYEGKPAVLGVAHDITDRKRAEKALQEEQEQSRQIIETARDAFVSMTADGIITDWNPQAEEIFGWSREEALGRLTAETIIPKALREAHTKGLKHYLATGEGPVLNQQIEITALHHDGHTIPIELSIVAVHTDDTIRFNAFIRDISVRRKVMEELKKGREQLRSSLIGTVVAVSRAVGARDPYTAGHQQRVSQLSRAIAQQMGLDAERIDGLRMGASIHDIGKIYLPAEILSKPAKLTDIEYKLIKSHAQVGYDILKDVFFPWPVADIAHQHHERLDGTGYPQGLKGDEICLEARIVAVADVVEAMASHRPYRPALGIDVALEEIETHRGSWFDPDVVDACLKLFREKGFTFES